MTPSKSKSLKLKVIAIACATAAVIASPVASAAKRPTAQQERAKAVVEMPICTQPIGSISVIEPEEKWWIPFQLGTPVAVIKVFVNKSKCFTLVDRGRGMDAAKAERELSYDGELKNQSNIGKGQIRAADYVLVPDLVSQNSNAGGTNIGGLIGGLIGDRTVGALVGGLSIKKKTADVVLTITDVRSSEQVAMAEGHHTKSDLGWSAGGGAGTFGSSLGGAGAGSYANTEIGQVITMAYLKAYVDIVNQMGGLILDPNANSQRAVTINKPARLFANPSGTGAPLRTLDVGVMLYPTGNKGGENNMMWEVEDELGNKGWVSSSLFELTKG